MGFAPMPTDDTTVAAVCRSAPELHRPEKFTIFAVLTKKNK